MSTSRPVTESSHAHHLTGTAAAAAAGGVSILFMVQDGNKPSQTSQIESKSPRYCGIVRGRGGPREGLLHLELTFV